MTTRWKRWLRVMVCAVAAFCSSAFCSSVASVQAAKRPNVLFLFTDDQRADTIAAFGNSVIRTPNLDRLVRSGFVFRNAYCMGSMSGAVCLPSRTMMHSGLSLFHLQRAVPSRPHFGRAMKSLGYTTYLLCKRGNSPHNLHKVFDSVRYLNDHQVRSEGLAGKVAADAAIGFLDSYKDEKPFFMYIGFAGPHDPRVAQPNYRSAYEQRAMPLPRNFLPLHPFNNGELTIRDESLAPWPRTPDEIRRHLRDYYAVITQMDTHIGRILAALKKRSDGDNTIIIFSSDHGLAVGSHGLMGKQSLYECAMKAPLIFSGPGIPHGTSDAYAYLYDIFPTTVDLVGGTAPKGLDGRSLKGILKGRQKKVRDVVFTAYKDVMRSVRKKNWKLIRYPQVNVTQLFDINGDPDENRDLAKRPEFSAKLAGMMSLLRAQQAKFDDQQALTSAHPDKKEIDAATLTKNRGKQRSVSPSAQSLRLRAHVRRRPPKRRSPKRRSKK